MKNKKVEFILDLECGWHEEKDPYLHMWLPSMYKKLEGCGVRTFKVTIELPCFNCEEREESLSSNVVEL